MSSSGLIYAGIVGAWAVYLVPVWLRREEQLNEARQKARYAAAIRTLGRPEQFEKRWAQDETLAATGTDGPVRVPAGGENTPAPKVPKKAAPSPGPGESKDLASEAPAPAKAQGPAKPKKVTLRVDRPAPGESPRSQPSAPVQAGRTPGKVLAASQRTRQTVTARLTPHERHQVRRRGVLLMRRRRMVALLFALTTAGAVAGAVLGVDYIGAMLAPAALMSLYIMNIRRDERLRAKERFRRRQAQLAAERRRDRERALVEAQAAVQDAARDAPVWRPGGEAEGLRRAANG